MAVSKIALIEARIASLENEVKQLKDRLKNGPGATAEKKDGLDDIWESFAGYPVYDKVVALGRKCG